MKESESKKIKFERIKLSKIDVHIRGISPLLVNNFDSESFENPQGKHEKDEKVLFERSLYPKQNGHHVFPSRGLQKSMINAAHTFVPSIQKKRTKGLMIPEEWIAIEGNEPRIRIDFGNNREKGKVKIVRGEFPEWEMKFQVVFDPNGKISIAQIYHLIDAAGHFVGIGAWRPEREGIFGRFEVVAE